jgi:CheY-like chemotaxis protein
LCPDAIATPLAKGLEREGVDVERVGTGEEALARVLDAQSASARRDGRPNDRFGLGLAIVRELVVADGGSVQLHPAASGGLEAVVRLRRGELLETQPRCVSFRRPPGDRCGSARPGPRV